VKDVRIVNIDLETTTAMDKEFKWWFGQTPHMSDQFHGQLGVHDIEVPLLFIHHSGDDDTTKLKVTDTATSISEDDILVIRRKSKDYVPEYFTYF